MSKLPGGCRIVKKVGHVYIFVSIFLLSVSTFASNVTIDADDAAAKYKSLDDFFTAYNSMAAASIPDSVIFAGSNKHTYGLTIYPQNYNHTKKITFISASTIPDSFAIINHTSSDLYNFFRSAPVDFYRLTFTGSTPFTHNVTLTNSVNRELRFIQCVIRNYTDYFIVLTGDISANITFENCLFSNNTDTIIGIGYYNAAAPYLTITNCTFDNNKSVLSNRNVTSDNYSVANMSIQNNIFNNSSVALSGIRKKVGYSLVKLTTEQISDYGTGNKAITAADTLTLFSDTLRAAKTFPSSWKLGKKSIAENVGLPKLTTVDIEGTKRDTLSSDAGCWKFDNSLNITKQPKNDTLPVGYLTSFNVAVVSNADAIFYWYQKGNPTALSDNDTCQIAVTAEMDSTKFFCVISNPTGTISVTSDTVLLRTMTKPVLVKDVAEGINVTNGGSVTFKVAASGYKLRYRWYFNDTLFTKADTLTDSLTISSLDRNRNDLNTAYCVVYNLAGEAASQKDTIHVLENLPVITTQPKDDTLYENETATFTVAATGSTLKYTWFKIDPSTLVRTLIQNATTPTLSIGPLAVAEHDSTAYICYVSFLGDSAKSRIASLRVEPVPAPKITYQTGVIEEPIGANTYMFVRYNKISGVSYSAQWYFGGEKLTGKTGDTLFINPVASTSSGTYMCIVTNSAGKSDTSENIQLTARSANEIYNPISLTGEFVDRQSVNITIERFASLPASSGSFPHVDSIGIWWKYEATPTIPELATGSIKFSLSELISESAGANSIVKNIPVDMKDDECSKLYFVATPHWVVSASDDSLPPFKSVNAAEVYTCGTDVIPNPLTFDIKQPKVGCADIVIKGFDQLIKENVSFIVIYYGKTGDSFYYDTLSADEIPSSTNLTREYTNQWFRKVSNSVDWGIYIRAETGNYSDTNKKTVTVGYPIPTNDLTFGPISDTTDDQMRLSFSTTTTADSIRIWYQKDIQIDTASYTFNSTSMLKKVISGDSLSVLISNLDDLTMYYFAGQVQRNGIWSAIVSGAMTKARTKSTGKCTIFNTIRATNGYFDTLTNNIVIEFEFDTTGFGKGKDDFICGYTISKTSYLGAEKIESVKNIPLTKFLPGTDKNVIRIDLGDSIDFEQDYYIALYPKVKGEDFANSSNDANTKIKTGPIRWMPFVYFEKDTVRTFENKVRFVKDSLWTTIYTASDTLILSKFKEDAIPKGYIPVSVSLRIKNPQRLNITTTSLQFGLKIDSLPNGYSFSDVNMYTYDTTGRIRIVYNKLPPDEKDSIASVSIQPYQYSEPFILMIDTVKPVVAIKGDTSSAVLSSSSDIIYNIKVKDNCANVSAVFEYGSGSDSIFKKDTILDTVATNFQITGLSGKVSKDFGVYAKLYIKDGRYSDTIDLSRTVKNTLIVNTKKMKWHPLCVNYELTNQEMSQVFDSLSGLQQKKYDNSQFRLFKWYDSTSKQQTLYDGYVEYSQINSAVDSSMFRLKPGNLLWIKTREIKTMNFGEVTTLSLKKNYSVKLPPNKWVDVAVPFGFSIKVYDIIKASGLDTLPNKIIIKKWITTDDSLYSNSIVHNPTTGDEDPAADMTGIYTIQNFVKSGSKDTVLLKFPPIPSCRSGFKPPLKKKSTGIWNYVIEAKSENEVLNPVYCGYNQNETGYSKTLVSLSPSFSSVTMGIFDNGNMYGIDVSHENTDGYAYNITFVNNNSAFRKAMCSINEKTPSGKLAKIFNSSTGLIENKNTEFSVDIEANSSAQRYLLVGTSDFINNFIRMNRTYEFDLMKLYPNPFRGTLNIKFMVPLTGVTTVNCMLYDALGREVWMFDISKGLHPGLNTFVWKQGERTVRKIASGTYFLKLVAKNNTGKTIGVKQSKLMYLSN